jgi:hypothetical protein
MRHLFTFESKNWNLYESSEYKDKIKKASESARPFLDAFFNRINPDLKDSDSNLLTPHMRHQGILIKSPYRGLFEGSSRIISSLLEDPKFKEYQKMDSPMFTENHQKFSPYLNWGLLKKGDYYIYIETRRSTVIARFFISDIPDDIPGQKEKISEGSIKCLFWDGSVMFPAEFEQVDTYEEKGRQYDEPYIIIYEYVNSKGERFIMEADFFGSPHTDLEFSEITNVEKVS